VTTTPGTATVRSNVSTNRIDATGGKDRSEQQQSDDDSEEDELVRPDRVFEGLSDMKYWRFCSPDEPQNGF